MKTSRSTHLPVALCALASSASLLHAQPPPVPRAPLTFRQAPPSAEYTITSRAPNSRVWQRTEYRAGQDGKPVPVKHRYVEIGSGLCHPTENGYADSDPSFELTPDGYAISRHCQHRAIVAPNVNSPDGVIDFQTPAGQRLRSAILGLTLHDAASGKTLQIAAVKDCPGRQTAPNEITFADAFEGLKASVRVRNEIGRFHQEVVLHEKLTPAQLLRLGFPPVTTRLQVWTDFPQAPVPAIRTDLVRSETNPLLRNRMAEPDTLDDSLDFSSITMAQGSAFAEPDSAAPVRVFKKWLADANGTCLVESADFADLQPLMQNLPESTLAAYQPSQPSRTLIAGHPLPARAKAESAPRYQIARADPPRPGNNGPQVILDYVLINSTLTNVCFDGGTTYYVSASAYLTGSNVFCGGAVFKHATNAGIIFEPSPPTPAAIFLGSAYRPIVFTAKDDDTIGEVISGSTSSPSGYYGNPALTFVGASVSGSALSHVRFLYARQAIAFTGLTAGVSDAQFINCQQGLYGYSASIDLGNCLFANTLTNLLSGGYAGYSARNVTFCGSAYLATAPSDLGTTSVSLKNCILANVTNLFAGAMTTNADYNAFYQSPSFGDRIAPEASVWPFQSAGAGQFYLCADSPYRDFGTESIGSQLLAELRQRTTRPPLLLSNITTSVDTVLSPQAERDWGSPDLGFHYQPVDFITHGYAVTNATLTITNGTVIAYYDTAGIWLQDGAQIICEGSPIAPNRFVDYRTVQEQPVKLGSYGGTSSGTPVYPFRYNNVGSPAWFRFTEFARMAAWSYPYNLYMNDWGWRYSSLAVSDCRFSGGDSWLGDGSGATVGLTNSLIENGNVVVTGDLQFSAFNNLFRRTSVGFDCYLPTPWVARDNVFELSTVGDWGDTPLAGSYNAFINATNQLYNGTNATDIVLTNFVYASGPLGDYYQLSTNLLNRGSRTADLAQLYHFTTQTNLINGLQIKETNSIVDCGLHYAACGANGLPVDSDGDGIPDVQEDRDGDGQIDSGETDWTTYNSQNGLTGPTGLQVFTPLR